jgi:hypothetical protein
MLVICMSCSVANIHVHPEVTRGASWKLQAVPLVVPWSGGKVDPQRSPIKFGGFCLIIGQSSCQG